MRARNIKPGFFKNERLSDLPPECRILFIGLWCLADREGRLEDRPKRIKAEVFPYENRNVDIMLNKLHNAGFIQRYEADGRRCILVVKFKCHQNPHPHERASELPAPSDIVTCNDMSVASNADVLNPSSLNPDIRNHDITDSRQRDSAFDQFWSLYPRKVAKGQAEKAWATATKRTDAQTIIAGLRRLLPGMQQEDKQFIKHPSTWLNGKCWEDDDSLSSEPSEEEHWENIRRIRERLANERA